MLCKNLGAAPIYTQLSIGGPIIYCSWVMASLCYGWQLVIVPQVQRLHDEIWIKQFSLTLFKDNYPNRTLTP